MGQDIRCRYKQGSRQDRFRIIIPVKCGSIKMVIYDPEIAAVACYRYSLIEFEREDWEDLPPGTPFYEGSEDSLPFSDNEGGAS